MTKLGKLWAAAAFAGLGTAAGISLNAQGAGEVRVYKGEPVQQIGVAIAPWGSGEIRESEEKIYVGTKSLRVVTHGRYQGARLILQTPVDLKAAAADPTAYLVFTLTLANRDSSGGMGMGGDYGSMMRNSMRGRPGGNGPGGIGAGGPSGPGPGASGEAGAMSQKPISKLRVVLVGTDGKRMETWLPLESATATREDWKQLAIPVSAIPGLKESAGTIKEVQVFGDTPAILYFGEVRVVRDETPIRVDDLPERTVAVNDPVQFVGSAEGGITPLVYEWDFDSQDGVAVDKDGKVVTHRFRKSKRDGQGNSQPFIVTLTVRDLHGIKKPSTRTTKVLVTL